MVTKTYLICISFNSFTKAIGIITNFLNTDNKDFAELILVENGNKEYFKKYLDKFENENNLKIIYSETPNKSECLNRVITNIKDKEALIICIDNDIEFRNGFVRTYIETAIDKGNSFYFGGEVIVPKELSCLIKEDYKLLYQGSQSTKTSTYFIDNKLPFLGANFCFFKSQWEHVGGFDERFGPGSQYGLAGQESTFQKKLKYVGYKPFFVFKNSIVHFPEKDSYTLKAIRQRTQINGFTHGFNFLTQKNKNKIIKYIYNLGGMMKAILKFKLNGQTNKYVYKVNYFKGYIKSLLLFIKTKETNSIFRNLEKNID